MTGFYFNKEIAERYQFWVYAAAMVGAVVSVAVIIGWLFNLPLLLTLLPGLPAMKMNTAIGTLMMSAGVALMQKIKANQKSSKSLSWILAFTALILLLIGISTLVQHTVTTDLGIDDLFLKDWLTERKEGVYPGRMTVLTAASFVLFGGAFIVFLAKWKYKSQIIQALLLPIMLISVVALISFAYGIHEQSKALIISRVAVNTATIMFVLSIAGLFVHQDTGLARLLSGIGSGNTMARKIMFRITLFALCFGFVRVQIFRFYRGDEEFSIVFSLMTYILISGFVIWFTANEMNEIDAKRDTAEIDANLMELFIKEAPSSIAVFDTQMRYLAHSRNWVEDYNLQEKELTGKSHYDIFPEIDDEWKKIHQRCLAGETIHRDEDKFVRADNTVQWVKWEDRPWYKTDGSIGGIIMFTLDVTPIKKAKDELLLANQKVSSILDAATHVSIISTDVNGLITSFSKGAEAMLGYTANEIVGKQTPVVVHDRNEVKSRTIELTKILGIDVRP